MSLSAMSPFKRLMGGVAVAALAITLAACSEEKKETSAAPESHATTESAATQPAPAAGADTVIAPFPRVRNRIPRAAAPPGDRVLLTSTEGA